MVTRMERNSHTEDENNRLKKCVEALVDTRFRQIEHFKEVTSTNDELISRAPKSEKIAIVAMNKLWKSIVLCCFNFYF